MVSGIVKGGKGIVCCGPCKPYQLKISSSVGPTCISPLWSGDEPEKTTTNGADLESHRREGSLGPGRITSVSP
ncbi:hypothetical protein PILCRDRAFT_821108 [Piloderma croceum F 1598]|uniref:Uncharacterized protein n=1 Tax=Piloderma croceum (strain F 1598) TaxID=765440 RepID=A0A0C3FPW8_PILCF|nr:hypothetical protein PILCRDRAFT_821108 [Piloderma croceum F 1598]